jgi:hypothetical protein
MPLTLERTTYKPNFDDPRVRKKVAAVLAWCGGMTLSKHPRAVHHDELRRVFGNTSQGLAQWLYASLLTPVGQYVPGKKSLSYRLKRNGYEKIHALMNLAPPHVVDVAQTNFAAIIDGTEAPEYMDKGDRRYHPIQSIERGIRKRVFSGWWDYDIESSGATLVHQYALQFYRFTHKNEEHSEPFSAVAHYINDKASVRKHISALTGLNEQATKELLTAILFRATMAPTPKASIFRHLGCDYLLHQKLVNDEFVKQFKVDVKRMWLWARLHDNYEVGKQFIGGKGRAKRPAKTSKHRQAIYMTLERRVVDAMIEKLVDSRIRFVLMHDGFMTKGRTDVAALMRAVELKTGFVIRLSEFELGEAVQIDEDPDVESVKNDKSEPDDEIDEADRVMTGS